MSPPRRPPPRRSCARRSKATGRHFAEESPALSGRKARIFLYCQRDGPSWTLRDHPSRPIEDASFLERNMLVFPILSELGYILCPRICADLVLYAARSKVLLN